MSTSAVTTVDGEIEKTIKDRLGLTHLFIFWCYTLQGLMIGNWAALIPSVASQLDISNGVLGDLLCFACLGALTCVIIVPLVTNYLGSGIGVISGGILMAATFIVIGFCKSTYLFGFAAYFYGLSLVLIDASCNHHCIVVEKAAKYPLLGKMHACYNVGALSGSLIGGALLNAGLSVWEESICIYLPVIVLMAVSCFWYYDLEQETFIWNTFVTKQAYTLITESNDEEENKEGQEAKEEKDSKQKSLSNKDLCTLVIVGLISFIACFGNGTVTNWSAKYLEDNWGVSSFKGIFGFASYQATQIITKVSSDYLLYCLNSKQILLGAGIICFIGAILSSTSDFYRSNYDASFDVAVVGFALQGMGFGPIPPMTFALSAILHGISPEYGVAFCSSMGNIGFFLDPPVSGNISDQLGGLQWSFFFLSMFFIVMTSLVFGIPKRYLTLRKWDW